VILAKERGCFPIWDFEREKDNPFIQRIKDEDVTLYNEMMVYGRRNIALLTIAPAGTTSLMTQTTSGIEPVFLPSYMRRRKINPHEKDVKIDFTDKQGDTWQEYSVFHHKFETWLQVNGYNVDEVKKLVPSEITKIIEKSPYFKATSADVDWVKKVEMQGRMQKHIDHSISNTINLPADATEELVAKVYETGWRVGCKGLTVYRDGCRSGVLNANKEEKKSTFESHAIKRPTIVNCDVWNFQNNYEKWIAVVGKVAPKDVEQTPENELPYELFTGKLDSFPIPSYVERGQIIKRKVKDEEGNVISVYDFKYIDKDGYPVLLAGLSRKFKKEYWNYAKLISAILRHGMAMPYVVNLVGGLKLEGDSLNTWQNGVVRTLKRYIKDGTISQDACEVCGAKLTYVEGCLKCNSCGLYSKCG
jgi:ribonucleoside-diphosphate reductase alpha chain